MGKDNINWGVRQRRTGLGSLLNEGVVPGGLAAKPWPFHQRPGARFQVRGLVLALLGLLGGWTLAPAATSALKLPVAPKWGRFERSFTSSLTYTNPLQEATLKVQFTSPLGERAMVYGFWDGGRTWRVRFAPDQPGHWTFTTLCSDSGNTGLNAQHGEFLCTSTIGQSRFHRHGPVRVALDKHHFEQADGTPFFWLADTVDNGARMADLKGWETYAVLRASQNFSVAQWAVAPGGDLQQESALTGFPERIGVNPDFFKRLDLKLEILSEAGLLSAISPIAAPEPQAVALPDDQAVLLTRYLVARWGAEPVAWLLRSGNDPKQTQRWKKIGAEIFSGYHLAPVVVCAAEEDLSTFSEEPWVNALGVQLPLSKSENAQRINQISDAHPVIFFTPHENAVDPKVRARVRADQVRHSAYCGLLMAPPAGVSYAGLAVENWDTTVEPKKEDAFGAGLPLWHKALFMPGAKQLGQMANLFGSIPFWQLRPAPGLLASPPGDNTGAATPCAAASPAKDLALVYAPDERMLELSLDSMPRSPTVTWFNPRQAGNSPAVAVVVQGKCQFPTPSAGDWLLVLKAGK